MVKPEAADPGTIPNLSTSPADLITAGQHLSDEQANRVWSFALHLDGEFTQRGNFFLVGQSMLVVAYAALLTSQQTVLSVDYLVLTARVIACFGLVLSVIWMYIQVRHMGYLHFVRRHLLKNFSEYREIYAYREKRKIPTSAAMAIAIPGITSIMWIILALLS